MHESISVEVDIVELDTIKTILIKDPPNILFGQKNIQWVVRQLSGGHLLRLIMNIVDAVHFLKKNKYANATMNLYCNI